MRRERQTRTAQLGRHRLGDLRHVERRALAEVVAADEQVQRACGSSIDRRTRPTQVGSVPTTSAGVGKSPGAGLSHSTTPGAVARISCARATDDLVLEARVDGHRVRRRRPARARRSPSREAPADRGPSATPRGSSAPRRTSRPAVRPGPRHHVQRHGGGEGALRVPPSPSARRTSPGSGAQLRAARTRRQLVAQRVDTVPARAATPPGRRRRSAPAARTRRAARRPRRSSTASCSSGLAMMPRGRTRAACALISGTTSGTSASMRKARRVVHDDRALGGGDRRPLRGRPRPARRTGRRRRPRTPPRSARGPRSPRRARPACAPAERGEAISLISPQTSARAGAGSGA